ncbi:hypothetical protein K461DRAFT_153435 [Myriangium duriaei CBS 260.36]|uniref:Uncharacterized protein n=1 Tax=Myriangium duriaei CBS 260.36 TaxID=1168546 RepID=A0A9P4J364_9PEZI|nr:hypothetical protein K461DRAFT_153435 [Myriangium duriaei CBS 260.36]
MHNDRQGLIDGIPTSWRRLLELHTQQWSEYQDRIWDLLMKIRLRWIQKKKSLAISSNKIHVSAIDERIYESDDIHYETS